MNVFDKIKAMGAEVASNRAVLTVEGHRTIVGRFVDGEMQLTPEGEALVPAVEEKPKRKNAKAKPADGDDE